MSKKAITFKGNPTVEMQFGSANICTGIGQNTKTRNPVVTFHTTENDATCKTENTVPSVIMEFSSIKSIEVLERQLMHAKMILFQEFCNR